MTRAGARTWVGLAALVLPVLITSMDISVLYLAIPSMSADLTPTAGQLLWIVDSYGFFLAALLITMGNVGDRIGRRRLLIIGAVVFGIGSVLAAYSPTPELLIVARALMGIGGSTLMPSTLSLIRNMFHDDDQRGTAIGIWSAAFAGGAALGPVVGGILLQHFAWGSVFLINVPMLAIMLIVVPLVVPEYRHPRPDRLDLIGVLLSIAAILPIVYAIKHAAEALTVDAVVVLGLVVGIGAAVAFVRRQRRAATPLVDLALFRRPAFGGSVLGGMMAMLAMLGSNLFLAQYLQLVLGLDPLPAALWTLPGMVTVAIGAVTAARLRSRLGNARTFLVGFVVSALGIGLLIFTPDQDGLAVIVIAEIVFGYGLSTVMTIATDVVVASAPPERAGAASAISETGNELGAALGVAVLGSIGTAVYRSTVGAGLPGDLPAAVRDEASATLANALAVAGDLAPAQAAAVIDAARSAFVGGMSVVAICGTAILVALAVFVPWLVGRRSQPSVETSTSVESVR